MNTQDQKKSILVWDFPVRVFHWLLVVSFTGAWLTSESETFQMIHYAFGYSAIGLVLFRLLWGVIGTRYARFSEFVKSPLEIFSHLKLMLKGHYDLGIGHNPAGAIAMIFLMFLILLIGITGYWSVKEFWGDFMNEAHEAISSVALVGVVIHVAAAIVMSHLQKENLIKSMVTGNKLGTPEQAIRYPQYLIGLALALGYGYCFYLVVVGALPLLTQ